MATAERKGPGRDSTSGKAINTAQRHARWLQLRQSGKTYQEIAELDGVAKSTVQEAVARRLADVTAEPAKELLDFEVSRIDALISVCWDEAQRLAAVEDDEMHLAYVEQARKLLADRRKLLGVEGVTKVQHSYEKLSDEQLHAELAAIGITVQIGEKP